MDLYTWAIVAHVVGAVIGVGVVTVFFALFLRSIGDKEIAVVLQKSDSLFNKLIMSGLGLLVVSGLYFMFSKPVLWGSEKILTKLGIVGLLIINGAIINKYIFPKMAQLKPDDWGQKTAALKSFIRAMLPFDAISLSGWYAVLFLGAVGRQSWNIWQIIFGYFAFWAVVYLSLKLITNKKLNQ